VLSLAEAVVEIIAAEAKIEEKLKESLVIEGATNE